jgi:hypothetical protein
MTLSYFIVQPGMLSTVEPALHLLHNLYSAMWSNIWAPSAWTLLGIVIADIRQHRRQQGHHEDNKAVIRDLAGQIKVMSDKLKSLTGGEDDDELSSPDRADPASRMGGPRD